MNGVFVEVFVQYKSMSSAFRQAVTAAYEQRATHFTYRDTVFRLRYNADRIRDIRVVLDGPEAPLPAVMQDELTVNFVVTDTVKDVNVAYTGLLPDLFKEGKGAVVQGKLDASGKFVASEVLAKHDENYMPAEAQHAIDTAKKNEQQANKHTSPSTLKQEQ
jgi:hypothetical protein